MNFKPIPVLVLSGFVFPVFGHDDGENLSVFVQIHPVDAEEPGVSVLDAGLVPVVYHQILIRFRQVQKSVVAGAVCDFAVPGGKNGGSFRKGPVKLPTKRCPTPVVRSQISEGWYFNSGSMHTGVHISQPPTYPTHRISKISAKL